MPWSAHLSRLRKLASRFSVQPACGRRISRACSCPVSETKLPDIKPCAVLPTKYSLTFEVESRQVCPVHPQRSAIVQLPELALRIDLHDKRVRLRDAS
jgi:hypothetical protein